MKPIELILIYINLQDVEQNDEILLDKCKAHPHNDRGDQVKKRKPKGYTSKNYLIIDEIVALEIANAAMLNQNYKKLTGALKID